MTVSARPPQVFPAPPRRAGGFTLIELLVTLAIVGVLASAALPLGELAVKRTREHDLQTALREIRTGIDAYKRAFDEGRIEKSVTDSGYPKSLEQLYKGVPDQKRADKAMIYFMRRLPRDPLYPDSAARPEDTWARRSYESGPDDPREGEDVFDVYSRSGEVGMNGIPYRDW